MVRGEQWNLIWTFSENLKLIITKLYRDIRCGQILMSKGCCTKVFDSFIATDKTARHLQKLRNVIQDFPVLLTFSFKTYKHVLLLNKSFGHNGPWFVLSAKLNSPATWCTLGHLFRFAHYTTTIFFCHLWFVCCCLCFVFLISVFLSFEVVSHQQVFR